MVCGATQSGKTYFVQRLLESNQNVIHPAPGRIIWCYGVHQPAYDEMVQSIKPGIVS